MYDLDTQFLINACKNGHLLTIKEFHLCLENSIKKNIYTLFITSVKYGHLDLVRQFYTWYGDKFLSINYELSFKLACEYGHLSIVRQIYEWYHIIIHSVMYKNNFLIACIYGHLDIIIQLYTWKPININTQTFNYICINGHNDNIDKIIDQLYIWNPQILNTIDHHKIILSSIKKGHIKLLTKLYKLIPNITLIDEYFILACNSGQLEIAIQLYNWNPELINTNIDLENIQYDYIIEFITFYKPKPMWLSTIKSNNNEFIECPICRLENSFYIITPCNHKFCEECITKWINEKINCPYCRSIIR